MKMDIEFLDNAILLDDEIIPIIEIENKAYFYRIVNDLYSLMNNERISSIKFFDESSKEILYGGKIQVFLNFFDFEFDSKKYINGLLQYIVNELTDADRENIVKNFNKLKQVYKKILNGIDIPVVLNVDSNIDSINKIMKIGISSRESLLENLLLIIDLERELKINKILFFVNLKQYLLEEELKELYKYSLYSQVKIVLIDSQCYGVTNEYEKKLIIDNNLDEFMLK